MNLRNFEEFLKEGYVKKQTPNRQRALSLIKEAEEKKRFLEISIKNIPEGEMNANFVVESCYDILMELVRAKMFLDGYNSSNSHEAEVAYLRILGMAENDVRFVNEIRYYRNGIKYYGTILNKEYSGKVLDFMNMFYPKVKGVIKV